MFVCKQQVYIDLRACKSSFVRSFELAKQIERAIPQLLAVLATEPNS